MIMNIKVAVVFIIVLMTSFLGLASDNSVSITASVVGKYKVKLSDQISPRLIIPQKINALSDSTNYENVIAGVIFKWLTPESKFPQKVLDKNSGKDLIRRLDSIFGEPIESALIKGVHVKKTENVFRVELQEIPLFSISTLEYLGKKGEKQQAKIVFKVSTEGYKLADPRDQNVFSTIFNAPQQSCYRLIIHSDPSLEALGPCKRW